MLRQGANFEPTREQITSSFRPLNSSVKIGFRIAMLIEFRYSQAGGRRIFDYHSCKNNKIGKDPKLFDDVIFGSTHPLPITFIGRLCLLHKEERLREK